MNSPPRDEFDAARIVVDVLRAFRPEAQARVIRWAQEKLGGISSPAPGADDTVGMRPLAAEVTNAGDHELALALDDPALTQRHSTVDRMLYVLSVAHRLKPDVFEKILLIQGRGRRYFAKSAAEILRSGKSTQPRNIPGTEYWVMTNSQTSQKQEVLERALRLLGFSRGVVKAAVAAIA